MSRAIKIDDRKYARILSKALPRPIRNDADLDSRTAELLRLADLREDDKLSPEENEYAELLGALIEHYEDEHYPIELTAAPHESLAALMELKEIPQSKVAELIGSRGLTSDILKGKREISKALAKKLADFFHAPVELFI